MPASALRIDDISVNTDMDDVVRFVEIAADHGIMNVILAISPTAHTLGEKDHPQRVFPSIYNAHGTSKRFFEPDLIGIPDLSKVHALQRPIVLKASHGLIHIDHRLLTKDQQRMSIVISCSLVGSLSFVPPFNKYNEDTLNVCEEEGITLIKFESGWKHVMYNPFTGWRGLYYVHTHDLTPDQLNDWFKAKA